jgi:hypothetical protein
MRMLRAFGGICLTTLVAGACSVANSPSDPLPNSAFRHVDGAIPACAEGAEACGFACVDLKTNPAHCGKCDAKCPSGQNCVKGKCQFVCGGDSVLCGANKCVDVNRDPLNCGDCGKVCTPVVNATQVCQGGMCVSQCKGTFRDCDAKTDNGCETDVAMSQTDCGACGVACPDTADHAAPVCMDGTCTPNCEAGYADCDHDLANGCEIYLLGDPANCGTCGKACDATNPVCSPDPQDPSKGLCQKGLAIKVEGHADVLVSCMKGDYSCQAKQVCEKVTNNTCTFQQYDCYYGNQGSWYPNDGQSGSSNFNFAFTYDLAGGNYGNICACNQAQMQKYGLAANHSYCGLGHWTRQ